MVVVGATVVIIEHHSLLVEMEDGCVADTDRNGLHRQRHLQLQAVVVRYDSVIGRPEVHFIIIVIAFVLLLQRKIRVIGGEHNPVSDQAIRECNCSEKLMTVLCLTP